MPNIELHGFGNEKSFNAMALRTRIFELFWSFRKDILKEIVVTIYSDEVWDYLALDKPFIRLVSTPCENLSMITGRLMTLHVDVEVMLLNDFHPKK